MSETLKRWLHLIPSKDEKPDPGPATQPGVTITSSGALQVNPEKLLESEAAKRQLRALDDVKVSKPEQTTAKSG